MQRAKNTLQREYNANKILKYFQLILLSICIFTTLQSQEDPSTVEEAKEVLSDIQKKLSKEYDKISDLSAKETNILIILESLDFELQRSRKEYASAKLSLQNLSLKKKTLERETLKLKKSLDASIEKLKKVLVMLYKNRHFNYLEVLFASNSYSDLALKKKIFSQVFVKNAETVKEYNISYKNYHLKYEKLQTNEMITKNKVELLEQTTKEIQELKTGKQSILKDIENKKDIYRATVNELKQRVKNLNNKINSLMNKKARQIQFERNIVEYKGLLKFPVTGIISQGYGTLIKSKYEVKIPHSGLDFSASYGSEVKSIFDGNVIFADRFQGYGNLVIVDHGQDIFSLYAHLAEINVKENQRLLESDLIGLVGDTGSLKGPYLYFELRKNGKPFNPKKWFK
ncbi:MAG: peptidoglycan DD-metalloendopeptidase family protein [Pseudomonadota bacterium]